MAGRKRRRRRNPAGAVLAIGLTVLAAALGVAAILLFGSVEMPAGPAGAETGALRLRATPSPTPTPSPSPAAVETPAATPTPLPTPRGSATIHIRVVGDVMVHEKQLEAAEEPDGSYTFLGVFDPVKESLQNADLTVGNLETTFAGEAEGYSGFPHFNTPDTLADALADAGFDVMTLANNHTLDHKAAGVARTVQVLKEKGLRSAGGYGSQAQYDQVLLERAGEIQVGILAYTALTNRRVAEPFALRYLQEDTVKGDVAALRAQGADFILAMVHWGEEYEQKPGSSQKSWARKLVGLGVDAVMGSHPHVLQPAEFVTVQGEAGERRGFVSYSMGNFISNQQTRPRDAGIIFDLCVTKDLDSGETRLDAVSYIPTLVYKDTRKARRVYQVLPAGAYLEAVHPRASRIRSVWRETVALLGEEEARPLPK